MNLKPISFIAAKDFIARYHRHHRPPQGMKFCIGLEDESGLIGIAVVGRPVSRFLDDGYTAEVTRLCVLDGHKNACSMLYSACWRSASAMGFTKIITYILSSETGISLKAAGWSCEGEAGGGSWSVPSRPREDNHPIEKKVRWSKS
jgi:hypothetical protein